MKILTKQNLVDILYGCTILGTGGGGSLSKGMELIEDALAKGKQFKLVDFSEVPDDAMIATPYMCGSVSPSTPELEAQYADLPTLPEPEPFLAYKALEDYFGEAFYGVISTELGGGNTAEALYVGALLDRYIVDADPAGRSVPELQHSTYYLNDLPIFPLACANQFGDTVILTHVVNDNRAEALVRAMAVASKNRIGVVDHPAKAKTLKNAVIQGAISQAWEIGKIYRKAKEENVLAAPLIASSAGGFMLFQGRVSGNRFETVDGFTLGDVFIDGEGDYAGSQYHIWYKNEHLMAWRDEQVDVTAPDLICVFNDDTNEPNINPHFNDGMNVSVIGLPAPAQWRTKRGVEALGPKYFGFDVDYRPIEDTHERK